MKIDSFFVSEMIFVVIFLRFFLIFHFQLSIKLKNGGEWFENKE